MASRPSPARPAGPRRPPALDRPLRRPRAPGRPATTSGTTRAPARSSSARPKPKPRSATASRNAARNRGPGPLTLLVRAVGRGLRGLWLGLAHLVGGAVRRVGHGARDLDPALGATASGCWRSVAPLLVASAVWWHLDGPVTSVVDDVVVGLMGRLAWAAPLLLVAAAWRILRHPERQRPSGSHRHRLGRAAPRAPAAWSTSSTARRSPHEGADAMRSGGGWLGFLAAAPLVAGVTSFLALPSCWSCWPVSACWCSPATPVHQVARPRPRRCVDRLLRRPAAPQEGDDVIDAHRRRLREPLTAWPVPPSGRARWPPTTPSSPSTPRSWPAGDVRRCVGTAPTTPTTEAAAAGRHRRRHRRRPRPSSRSRPGSSSSRSSGDVTYHAARRPTLLRTRAPRTRPAPRPTTTSSRRSPACSTSSRSTRRSPASPAGRPSPATRSSSARPSRSSGSPRCSKNIAYAVASADVRILDADPRQVRDRHRDPQRRPRDRQPRRRAALARRHAATTTR